MCSVAVTSVAYPPDQPIIVFIQVKYKELRNILGGEVFDTGKAIGVLVFCILHFLKLWIKRQPTASDGQQYPQPCCSHVGNLKCVQGPWAVFFPYLNQNMAVDLKGTMSYRTRENFHLSVLPYERLS